MNISNETRCVLERLADDQPWRISIGPIDDLGIGPPMLYIYRQWWVHISLRLWPIYLRIAFPTRKRVIQHILDADGNIRISAWIELGKAYVDMDAVAWRRTSARALRAKNRREKVSNFVKDVLETFKIRR